MRELSLNEISAINGGDGVGYSVIRIRSEPNNSSDSQNFDSGYGGGTVGWNTTVSAG